MFLIRHTVAYEDTNAHRGRDCRRDNLLPLQERFHLIEKVKTQTG